METFEKIEAVQRMLDYIEAHLTESVTLSQLAQAAGYSPWYASRLFKDIMNKTAFDYLRQRRMTEAARILSNGDHRVVDVALDFVFDSHEGFSRAFSKNFGMSPQQYAKERPPVQYFLPYSIKAYYEYLLKQRVRKGGDEMAQDQTIFVQVIDKPARKAIIKRGIKATHYFEYCEEVGCDVWGVLVSVKEALSEPVGMWLPEGMVTPGTSVYVQGVDVPLTYNGVIPEGFELIELPACQMMVFQGAPFEDADFGEAIEALWAAIDRYDPKLYGFDWDVAAGPRMQMEPQGYRGYIEMKPVKRL